MWCIGPKKENSSIPHGQDFHTGGNNQIPTYQLKAVDQVV